MIKTKNDRCDKCSAEAFVEWSKDSLTLAFCNHHSHQYGAELIVSGFGVSVDNSSTINIRPSVSANAD